MDESIIMPITIVVLFLAIFFLECISSDVVGTVVYAVPFIILFFIIMTMFDEFGGIFQILISILSIVNVVVIAGNLLKVIISS